MTRMSRRVAAYGGFRPNHCSVDFAPHEIEIAAKIVGVSTDFDLLARCEQDMRAALAGQATVARSQPYYLDIAHPLANKGVALSALARLLAVPDAGDRRHRRWRQ